MEEQVIPYVMAVARDAMIATAAGKKRADALAARAPEGGWQRLSCADGFAGPRLRDWALVATKSPQHYLLVRRALRLNEKGVLELAFYGCWSPRPVTLAELVAVAGARWGVGDCFAEAKGEAGLDHYQVRNYRAWYRHVTLPMLAHAFPAARRPIIHAWHHVSVSVQRDYGNTGAVERVESAIGAWACAKPTSMQIQLVIGYALSREDAIGLQSRSVTIAPGSLALAS